MSCLFCPIVVDSRRCCLHAASHKNWTCLNCSGAYYSRYQVILGKSQAFSIAVSRLESSILVYQVSHLEYPWNLSLSWTGQAYFHWTCHLIVIEIEMFEGDWQSEFIERIVFRWGSAGVWLFACTSFLETIVMYIVCKKIKIRSTAGNQQSWDVRSSFVCLLWFEFSWRLCSRHQKLAMKQTIITNSYLGSERVSICLMTLDIYVLYYF
jgi:hypothetical protein